MSKTIRLKKGFDINLKGKPEAKFVSQSISETFSIKPSDFKGILRAKAFVTEGDQVKAGTPLFYDKGNPKVMFTAPVSGEVIEITRGDKRKILQIKILADKTVASESFPKHTHEQLSSVSKEEAQEILLKSGAWTLLVQRPFGITPTPDQTPKSIHISAFDSSPLAPSTKMLLEEKEAYLQAGVDILAKLTTGKVHINVGGSALGITTLTQLKNVEVNTFHGAHPVGNVGIQIHHIDPINKGDLVWTLSVVDVALIGKLFITGEYDTSRVVALTGSEVINPGYIKTFQGAHISKLLAGNVKNGKNRVISGNVLTGENVGMDGYLGYFHHQVTVIPEGDQEEFLGWILPTTSKLSFHRAFGLFSFLNKNKEYIVDTNTHGEHRNFVVSGSFEQVLPMDILPTYLFKAIIANDYDNMEALGIYEVIEEDVALCEFIDVSKNELQNLVREGIELIRKS